MTITQLPWTYLDAVSVCVCLCLCLVYLCVCVCVCMSGKQGPALYWLCDLWPFSVWNVLNVCEEEGSPYSCSYTHTLHGQRLPVAIFNMNHITVCKHFSIYIQNSILVSSLRILSQSVPLCSSTFSVKSTVNPDTGQQSFLKTDICTLWSSNNYILSTCSNNVLPKHLQKCYSKTILSRCHVFSFFLGIQWPTVYCLC